MFRRNAVPLVIGVMLGACLLMPQSTAAEALPVSAPPVTAGRYLVKFVPGTDADAEATTLVALGINVVEVYREVFSGVAVVADTSVLDQLWSDPSIARVEPDRLMAYNADQPTPPWGLDRIDQRALPMSKTYTYTSAGAGVNAYVIDSGIFAGHVDFGGRVRSGFTTVLDGRGTDDCSGHGTHVAGILGGQTYGVAKSVSLVAVRVLDCNGVTTESQMINGLDWVIADHQAGVPAVANISIGGPPSVLIDNAVQALFDDGVSVSIAAGNSGLSACGSSPARVPSALTVAASNPADTRPSFSNWGPCVDLFAPGFSIPSAGIASPTASAIMTGTSMSAPHVAGAAALLLSVQPTLTPAEVSNTLLANTTPGVITSAGSTTPNRLLFTTQGQIGTPPPPPPTTTTTTSPPTTTTTAPATTTTTTPATTTTAATTTTTAAISPTTTLPPTTTTTSSGRHGR
jgi:subtilisin family serine protease